MIARVVLAIVAAAGVASADPRPDPEQKPRPRCSRVRLPKALAKDWAVVGEMRKGRKPRVLVLHRPTNIGHIVYPGECVGVERVPFDELHVAKPGDGVTPPPNAANVGP